LFGMTKETLPEFIQSTAGQVAEELARRGIAPGRRVAMTIEPDEPNDWIAKAWKVALAEGRSDDDIDHIIAEERKAVRPCLG